MVTLGSDIGEVHEDEEGTFFEAGGRAADAVIACYNRFATWESEPALGALDEGATKRLAQGNHLPFVDMFPWFIKAEKDYSTARTLLTSYLSQARPLIVLTYGDRQLFAVAELSAKFTLKAYNIKSLEYRQGRFVQEILGILRLTTLNETESRSDTVIIPCFHPGYQGHTGILREKAQQLFKLVSAIGWYAITEAIRLFCKHPSASRRQLCGELTIAIQDKLESSHPFGRFFLTSKKEYLTAVIAYRQGDLERRIAAELPKLQKVFSRRQHAQRGEQRYNFTRIWSSSEVAVASFNIISFSNTSPLSIAWTL
ncbi:Nn.00g049150.m01.CDS01 [Neocucurbitaria sp. VM-36]